MRNHAHSATMSDSPPAACRPPPRPRPIRRSKDGAACSSMSPMCTTHYFATNMSSYAAMSAQRRRRKVKSAEVNAVRRYGGVARYAPSLPPQRRRHAMPAPASPRRPKPQFARRQPASSRAAQRHHRSPYADTAASLRSHAAPPLATVRAAMPSQHAIASSSRASASPLSA